MSLEIIEQLYKKDNKLYIQTIKNEKRWCAFLEIIVNDAKTQPYICSFFENDTEIINCDKFIGCIIIKKIQTQFENTHEIINPWEIMHLTKLEFILSSGINLAMKIGDTYNNIDLTHLYGSNFIRFEHTGGDKYLNL